MDLNELMHPVDAAKELNTSSHGLEALANSTFLEKQWGYKNINGKSADWWYLKKQIEELKGLDTSALLGYRGQSAFSVEFEKWSSRVSV